MLEDFPSRRSPTEILVVSDYVLNSATGGSDAVSRDHVRTFELDNHWSMLIWDLNTGREGCGELILRIRPPSVGATVSIQLTLWPVICRKKSRFHRVRGSPILLHLQPLLVESELKISVAELYSNFKAQYGEKRASLYLAYQTEAVDRPVEPVATTDPKEVCLSSTAKLEAVVGAMRDGVWGDVCLVVKAPNERLSYTSIYANSKIISEECDYLRERIEKNAYATVADALRHRDGVECRREAASNIVSKSKAEAEQSVGESVLMELLQRLDKRAAEDSERQPFVFGDALPTARKVRYVPIKGFAATTLQRIVLWLQTGSIEFASLRSAARNRQDGNDEQDVDNEDACADKASKNGAEEEAALEGITPTATSREAYARTHPSMPAPASAKSIYRAAIKLNLVKLQELALEELDSQLDPSNIMAELFSPFTLSHPEIKALELDFAIKHWNTVRSEHSAEFSRVLAKRLHSHEAQKLFETIIAMTTLSTPARAPV